jgi:hypothetical protein
VFCRLNTSAAAALLSGVRRLVLGACLLGAIGCAPPEPATPLALGGAPEVGFSPGEQLRFDITVAGVLVGEAVIAVDPLAAGGDAAPAELGVSSRITGAGVGAMISHVDDQARTIIDTRTWRPVLTRTDATYGKNRFVSESTYAGDQVKVRYARNTGADVRTTLRFDGAQVFDAHTAMAATRTWDAEPGDTLALWLAGGKRIWHSQLTMIGPEVIGTDDGNRAALRIDGIGRRMKRDLAPDKQAPRTFSVWLSDDADRVPLRVAAHTEYGDVELTLAGYAR